MQKAVGKRCWAVPDGFLPVLTEADRATENGYVPHECACLLNTGAQDVKVELAFYFENKEPVIADVVLEAQRCRHVRIDKLQKSGAPVVERGVPYALVVTAEAPIVVQMSRLDTTQPNMAFLSAMAYPAGS